MMNLKADIGFSGKLQFCITRLNQVVSEILHLTPTFSEVEQLSSPQPQKWHSARFVSLPVQPMSSIQVGPDPPPNLWICSASSGEYANWRHATDASIEKYRKRIFFGLYRIFFRILYS